MRSRDFDFQIIDMTDPEHLHGALVSPGAPFKLRAIMGRPEKEIEVSCELLDWEHKHFAQALIDMGTALLRKVEENKNAM